MARTLTKAQDFESNFRAEMEHEFQRQEIQQRVNARVAEVARQARLAREEMGCTFRAPPSLPSTPSPLRHR